MRIAQLLVVGLPQVAVVLRDSLAAGARGDQGFGSSGRT
jgi:dUTPase